MSMGGVPLGWNDVRSSVVHDLDGLDAIWPLVILCSNDHCDQSDQSDQSDVHVPGR